MAACGSPACSSSSDPARTQAREALGHVAARPRVLQREVRQLAPRAGLLVDALQPLGARRGAAATTSARALERAARVAGSSGALARVGQPERGLDRRVALLDAHEAPQRGARRVPSLERDLEVGERLERLAVLRVLLDELGEDRPRALRLPGVREHVRLTEAKGAHGGASPPPRRPRTRSRAASPSAGA